MGSTGNPNNPWGQYDSYKDCSQGVCSVYCPQWCYVIFPPPPSFFFDDEDDSSSSSDFSPLLIALIGILASAFILVSYYTLISKYCHRRRQISSSSSSSTNREISVIDSWQQSNGAAPAPNPNGLDESLIKSIKVYKFKKGDGFVESSDCSVCLSEFEEDENLRLLPKCNHAFHLPCIDTWLKSHSNCPLCRSFIDSVNQPIATESDSVSSDLSEDSDSVVVNVDLETRSEIGSTEKPEEEEVENRRSSSVVLISDILREIDDDDDEEVGSSSRRFGEGDGEKTPPPSSDGKSSFLVRSKRSVSNGKFVISSYDRSRDYRLPN